MGIDKTKRKGQDLRVIALVSCSEKEALLLQEKPKNQKRVVGCNLGALLHKVRRSGNCLKATKPCVYFFLFLSLLD